MGFIKGINGLRAIAVLMVIFYHWGFPFGIRFRVDGGMGVDLFFVISGFLISRILLREKCKGSQTSSILKNFYVRRILRIFPIYYISLIILLLYKYPDIHQRIFYFFSYTENIEVFIHRSWNAWSHAWSLSVEEQFYFVWPFVIILIPKNKEKFFVYLFIVLGLIFQPLLWFVTGNPFAFVLTPACIGAFGVGALISIWEHEQKIDFYLKYYKWIIPPALAMFIYWTIAPDGGHFKYLMRFNTSILSGFLIILCIKNANKYYMGFLENRILRNLGIVSYGIYLFHYAWPVFYGVMFNKVSTSLFNCSYGCFETLYPNANYLLKVSTLFLLAFFSFYTIEKFFLSFKRYF